MGPWHEHHYRFWVLIVIALALLAACHYILFAVDSDLAKLPPDLRHSPDAILFAATILGLFFFALLLRSELKNFTSCDGNNARKLLRRTRDISDVHYQR